MDQPEFNPAESIRQRKTLMSRVVRHSVLVLMFIAILYGSFALRDKMERAPSVCIDNLHKIDGAKEQHALKHNKKPGDPVAWDDLYKPDGTGYLKELPVGLLGETYSINKIGTDPTCSSNLKSHQLPPVAQGGPALCE